MKCMLLRRGRMYNQRIQFAIDTLIEENYFNQQSNYYNLKEEAESGKSNLMTTVDDLNICIHDFDHKHKCEFAHTKNSMRKSVDHVILTFKDETWSLHLLEMKSSVNDSKWVDIRGKFRASYLNVLALCVFLGIKIDNTYAYTTYERELFTDAQTTTNPIALKAPLGEKKLSEKAEWESGTVGINLGEKVIFKHRKIKMDRTGDGLEGSYNLTHEVIQCQN